MKTTAVYQSSPYNARYSLVRLLKFAKIRSTHFTRKEANSQEPRMLSPSSTGGVLEKLINGHWLVAVVLAIQALTSLQASTLVGHWPFDDPAAATTLVDISGYGNHGVYTSDPFGVTGIHGHAKRFDGWSDRAEIPWPSELELSEEGTDFSLSFWIRLEAGAKGKWRTLMSISEGMDDGFTIRLHPHTNQLVVKVTQNNGTRVGNYSGESLPINTWTHVAVVKQDEQLKIYFDAVLVHSVTVGPNVTGNKGTFYVGNETGPHGTKCSLDDLRYYQGALQIENIQTLATRPDTRKPSAQLVAHWPFDEPNDSVTLLDISGNGNHGIYVSNPVSVAGVVDAARHFNGWSDRVEVPHSPELELGAAGADFSVSYWIRLEAAATGKWRTLMTKTDGSNRTFTIRLYPRTNQLVVNVTRSDGTEVRGYSVELLELNTWSHVAVVKEDDQLKIYLDAMLVHTATVGIDVSSNKGTFYIGNQTGPHGTTCSLDDLRLYQGALRESEISDLADTFTLRNLNNDAMWVWQRKGKLILTDPKELDELVRFCKANHISTVYFFAGTFKNYSDQDWETVISTLHTNRISIEALLGNWTWLMPEGGWSDWRFEDRTAGLERVKAVLDYQARHRQSPESCFDGIHLDVEIHEIEGIDPFTGESIDQNHRISWFLELIQQIELARTAMGFSEVEVPYHWDIGPHYPTQASAEVECTDEEKPGWQCIFDQLEKITFMSYADRTHVIDAIMFPELVYLDSMEHPPPVRFATEFQRQFKSFQLDPIGMGNEDWLAVTNLRENINSMMLSRPYFVGWAMHPYDNANENHGQYPDWVSRQGTCRYPSSILFNVNEDPKTIPSNKDTRFSDKVFVKINLKAHPDHAYSGNLTKNMMIFLPIGYGYGDEKKLRELKDNSDKPLYRNIAPLRWFGVNRSQFSWWELSDGLKKEELADKGVAWENPANHFNPNLGVVRNIVLEKGGLYRLVFFYNSDFVSQSISRTIVADYGKSGEGRDISDPVEITIYLGQMPDVNVHSDAEHANDSLFFYDSDLDGLQDPEESIFGTNPFNYDTDGDNFSDDEELDRNSDPRDPSSTPVTVQ